ncbi:MAG: type I-E CRISPR-associated protein Cas7/Cse4/CasC [Planctomycetes bacterium]|nr:type I-E CRISPR-associated protein Cas7/Cse4/CasC [Planctomycetota bacterium]
MTEDGTPSAAPRFLQIHTLTSYPASLLNRDDAGFAKRIPFGGVTRTRISSQCLKRHWRIFDGDVSLRSIEAPLSVRSRRSFEEFVVKPLVEEGVALDMARAATDKLMGIVLGSESKKERAAKTKRNAKQAADEPTADSVDAAVETAQVTVLGRPELDYLASLAREACSAAGDVAGVRAALEARLKDKALRQNIDALCPGKLEAGLGAALFGRMVTGDILARTDAALHVAHSFTVHAQQSESDYFSAIDDLAREDGEQGSGHINASELTSGLFYGYVVVDLRLLHQNLGGERGLAGAVIHRLIQMVATVSPGAKLGSTAPYSYSHLVLAESGRAQPRTLANAFLSPVRADGLLLLNAYRALSGHVRGLDGMYGADGERAFAGIETDGIFEELAPRMTLRELAGWSCERAMQAVVG